MARRDGKRTCLGAIAGAHGVRGEVRLKSFTQNPLDIASYGPLSSEDGARRFELRDVRQSKDHLVAAIAGVTSREDAAALKGMRLYVDRDRLPDVDEEDTWYYTDLEGLEARNTDGLRVGEVKAIQNYGAGDLVEIALDTGGTPVLVPFTADTVPEIDVKAGFLTIDPPEGLIDEKG